MSDNSQLEGSKSIGDYYNKFKARKRACKLEKNVF